MANTVKKILNIIDVIITFWTVISRILTGLVILVAILLIGVRLFGFMPYTVLSGSMEPTYPTGSMIYVVEVDPNSLEVDDPVTFYLDKNRTVVATHRIIEVMDDEFFPGQKVYRTQGDNNDDPDSEPLPSNRVIGKPVFCIPLLGYFANFVQTSPGRYIALIACGVILLVTFIPDLLFKKKEEEE